MTEPIVCYRSNDLDGIPSTPGSYLLLLHLHAPLTALAIGRLGTADLPTGSYLYCGSAWGPGGLRSRLRRHLRSDKQRHWHVDFLTNHVMPSGLIVAPQPQPTARLECTWTQRLLQHPLITAPVPGFGSSDCRLGCPAHLLYVPQLITTQTLLDLLSHR